MFILGFILFCSAPRLLAYIWLHIFHIPRGVLGLILMKRLPRSHDIIEKVQIPDGDGHYSIEGVSGLLMQSVSKIFIDYTDSCKRLLLAYGALTGLCFIFDLVEFLIQYIRFGYNGDEHSVLSMLFLTLIFLGLDLYYVAWVLQAKGKFPRETFSNAISNALFGFVEKMNNELYSIFNEGR